MNLVWGIFGKAENINLSKTSFHEIRWSTGAERRRVALPVCDVRVPWIVTY
jgi:hypothetical protein